MSEIQFAFNSEMRELFAYDDPSFPLVVWKGDFSSFINRSLSYHWHHEFEYCVVLTGTIHFIVEGNSVEVKTGEAIFINANAMHLATQVSEDNATIFTVSFLPALFANNERSALYRKYFLPILQSHVKGFVIEQGKLFSSDITNSLNEVYDIYTAQHSEYEFECLHVLSHLWLLTMSYFREYQDTFAQPHKNHVDEQKAKDMLNYIHNYYSEDITIDDIARHAGLSRSGCFRSFRQYTNKSPIDYLIEYRLSRAIHIMTRTEKTMTQIATECGFSSSSYFGKVFKQKYKISPLQYQKTLKSSL